MLDGLESSRIAPSVTMVKKVSKSTKPEPEEVPGQSERLRRLRKAFGFDTSTAFAAAIDVSVQRWNAFENGAPLSREVAFIVVRKFSGLSLDWLYFGKTEALPLELARRLGELDPPGKRKT
jgi:DNA-binding XRE family transcriptional regulator